MKFSHCSTYNMYLVTYPYVFHLFIGSSYRCHQNHCLPSCKYTHFSCDSMYSLFVGNHKVIIHRVYYDSVHEPLPALCFMSCSARLCLRIYSMTISSPRRFRSSSSAMRFDSSMALLSSSSLSPPLPSAVIRRVSSSARYSSSSVSTPCDAPTFSCDASLSRLRSASSWTARPSPPTSPCAPR